MQVDNVHLEFGHSLTLELRPFSEFVHLLFVLSDSNNAKVVLLLQKLHLLHICRLDMRSMQLSHLVHLLQTGNSYSCWHSIIQTRLLNIILWAFFLLHIILNMLSIVDPQTRDRRCRVRINKHNSLLFWLLLSWLLFSRRVET